MKMQGLDKTLFAGCAVAAVLAIGCGNNGDTIGNRTDPANRPGGEPGAAPTAGTAAESRDKNAITLTGCLQETKGVTGGYILTRANAEPRSSAPVGTSGRTSPGSDVEQKQMTAAAKSYRLSGETDELKNLVGHQIRVTGSVAEKSDMAEKSPTAGGSRDAKDRDKAGDIAESDLAKVDVTAVSDVADKCGTTGKTETGAKPKSKP
jgi:hypothetical protein